MKITSQPVFTIRKVPQKEGYGKGGSYTWLILMVQLILKQLINDMPPAAISPNIASQADLDMPWVKVIVQELPRINFIRKFRKFFELLVRPLWLIVLGR